MLNLHAGAGGLAPLSSTLVTENAVSVEFGLTGYSVYLAVLSGVWFSASSYVMARFSIGGNYLAGASHYYYHGSQVVSRVSYDYVREAYSSIYLGHMHTSSYSARGFNGFYYIFSHPEASSSPALLGRCVTPYGSRTYSLSISGGLNGLGLLDGVRFFAPSARITRGSLTVYGVGR